MPFSTRRPAIGRRAVLFSVLAILIVGATAVYASQNLIGYENATTGVFGTTPNPSTATDSSSLLEPTSSSGPVSTSSNTSNHPSNSSSTSQEQSSSSSLSESNSTVFSTSTEPCTAPGVICGGVQILNDSLLIDDNGDSTFTIVVNNTGSIPYQELQIILSNVLVLDRTGSWAVGNATQFSISIPRSQVALYAGATYKLEVDTFYMTDNVSYPVQQLASTTSNVTAIAEPTMTMMTG